VEVSYFCIGGSETPQRSKQKERGREVQLSHITVWPGSSDDPEPRRFGVVEEALYVLARCLEVVNPLGGAVVRPEEVYAVCLISQSGLNPCNLWASTLSC